MRQGKLITVCVFALAFSLAMLSSATGQTKKSSGKTGGAKSGASSAAGAKVFEGNCTVCHEGGNNTVDPPKTLKLAALKQYGFNGPEDIKKRVNEGQGIMPPFKDTLKPAEIDAVAAYVWAQAQKDWKAGSKAAPKKK
ncbi:MAG: c-type cytochrome [Acidobacteriota bacterium]